MKKMNDDEIQNHVWDKMTSDLDGIEAKSMFDEESDGQEMPHKDGTIKVEANGMTMTMKPMEGQQTAKLPMMEKEDDEDEMKLGK